MTPMERVVQRMKGLTWDEAEEVGIEILAKCVALHVYSRKEEHYPFELMKRVCKRADEWAHEEGVPAILAMAAMGHRLEKGKEP